MVSEVRKGLESSENALVGLDGRVAIISDIHGNLEALETVFSDIDSRNSKKGKSKPISEVWCLGDVVGYGPNPRECLELVSKKCKVILAGNHEIAARTKIRSSSYGLTDMSGLGAKEGIHWTVRQLFGDSTPIQVSDSADVFTQDFLKKVRCADYGERLFADACKGFNSELSISFGQRLGGKISVPISVYEKFLAERADKLREVFRKLDAKSTGEEFLKKLGELPLRDERAGVLLVHDNPLEPGSSKYLLDSAEAVKHPNNYAVNADLFKFLKDNGIRRVFFGHSHFQAVYEAKKYGISEDIKVVNPGSVGMPRNSFGIQYVIWNPFVKANDVVKVSLPMSDWEVTNKRAVACGLSPKLQVAYERLSEKDAVAGGLD